MWDSSRTARVRSVAAIEETEKQHAEESALLVMAGAYAVWYTLDSGAKSLFSTLPPASES